MTVYIAVPDGEPCELAEIPGEHFIGADGAVYKIRDAECYGVPLEYDGRPDFLSHYGRSDSIVQPVRLVRSDVLERVQDYILGNGCAGIDNNVIDELLRIIQEAAQ